MRRLIIHYIFLAISTVNSFSINAYESIRELNDSSQTKEACLACEGFFKHVLANKDRKEACNLLEKIAKSIRKKGTVDNISSLSESKDRINTVIKIEGLLELADNEILLDLKQDPVLKKEIKDILQRIFNNQNALNDDQLNDEIDYYYTLIRSLAKEHMKDQLTSKKPSEDNDSQEKVFKRNQKTKRKEAIKKFIQEKYSQNCSPQELADELGKKVLETKDYRVLQEVSPLLSSIFRIFDIKSLNKQFNQIPEAKAAQSIRRYEANVTELNRLQKRELNKPNEHAIWSLEHRIDYIKTKWNLSNDTNVSEEEIQETAKNVYSPQISRLLKEKQRLKNNIDVFDIASAIEAQKKIETDFTYSPHESNTTNDDFELRTKNTLDYIQKNVFDPINHPLPQDQQHNLRFLLNPWHNRQEYEFFSKNHKDLNAEENRIEREFGHQCTIHQLDISYIQNAMLLAGHNTNIVLGKARSEYQKERMNELNEKIQSEPCEQLQQQYKELGIKRKTLDEKEKQEGMNIPEYALALKLFDSGYFSNHAAINKHFKYEQQLEETEKDLRFWYSLYNQHSKNKEPGDTIEKSVHNDTI